MSNGDDTQQACCAAEICCGGDDQEKQRHAVKHMIKAHLEPGDHSLDAIVDVITEIWDLTPKSWGLHPFMRKVADLARTYPYI